MNPVIDRKVSGFQLSISTGMALETLFEPTQAVYDVERTSPQRVPLSRYTNAWFNIDTLIRNIMNATTFNDENDRFKSTVSITAVRSDAVAEALIQEVELIQSLFMTEGSARITPTFYVTDYASFYSGKDPENYQYRLATTEKQKLWFNTFYAARAKAIQAGLQVEQFRNELNPPRGQKAVILSHVALDLLSYTKFADLELLESHTGKIKTRREWNSKYQSLGQEKFENFPWSKPLLCWLGDKYVLKPLSITIRKKILAVAQERRWTPLTWPATVYNDCLTRIDDPEVVKILRQISLY